MVTWSKTVYNQRWAIQTVPLTVPLTGVPAAGLTHSGRHQGREEQAVPTAGRTAVGYAAPSQIRDNHPSQILRARAYPSQILRARAPGG